MQGENPPMFLSFFTALRDAQVPVTLREYLTLMEALDKDLADKSVEDFYYLSRACAGEGRAQSRQVRPRLRRDVFKGSRAAGGASRRRDSPNGCASWPRNI
jgi:uncharacterized protein with von Willebrand factor type A (vWA) domain